MSFPFSIVTGKTIHGLLTGKLAECVEVVQQAYLAHGRGDSLNPNSYFLRFPEKPSCRIIALPAYLGDEAQVAGIKWIASFPENVARGFPRASAILILNSYETGYPFACLESSIISAARTAASAVLAAEHMNGHRRIQRLGIIGTGLIAKYIYTFLAGTGWEIDAVTLYDLHPGEAEKFKANACVPGLHQEISCAPSLAEAVRTSDVVVFTTIASTPHVTDFELFQHNPLVLHISLRDLSPEILLRSQNVVDDVGHVMQASTSCQLAEQQSGGRAFVQGTLAELITGAFRLDRARPMIFSPFGLGVLDLAVGKWLYDLAVQSGEAIAIQDFFHETTR